MTERTLTDRELTERELAVIKAIAEGNSSVEITGQLYLSEATIKLDLRSVVRKLGAKNRTHAVALAIRHGLI